MEDDVLEKTTFWLTSIQAASLNNYLARTTFRFTPHEDLLKYCSDIRLLRGSKRSPYQRDQSIASSRNSDDMNTFRERDSSYGNKRPADSFREAYIRRVPSPRHNQMINQPPTPASIPSSSLNSQDLLNKIKEILQKDFSEIKSEFDVDILERGIKNGYYINADEFRVAAKQVIRAFASKHSRYDCTNLMDFKLMPAKPDLTVRPLGMNPSYRPPENSKMEVDSQDFQGFGHNSFDDNSSLFGESNDESKSNTIEKQMPRECYPPSNPVSQHSFTNSFRPVPQVTSSLPQKPTVAQLDQAIKPNEQKIKAFETSVKPYDAISKPIETMEKSFESIPKSFENITKTQEPIKEQYNQITNSSHSGFTQLQPESYQPRQVTPPIPTEEPKAQPSQLISQSKPQISNLPSAKIEEQPKLIQNPSNHTDEKKANETETNPESDEVLKRY